jgi:hypothetical protein
VLGWSSVKWLDFTSILQEDDEFYPFLKKFSGLRSPALLPRNFAVEWVRSKACIAVQQYLD